MSGVVGKLWLPIIPVPDDAPPHPEEHYKRGAPDFTWRYTDRDKNTLGYYCRFRDENGEPLHLPLSWCSHAESGVEEWRWVALPEPRPLYVCQLTKGQWRDGVTKIVVGDEAAVDCLALLLNDEFDVVTWPQDHRSVTKADWSWFNEGDEVIIWPDCHSEREPLTKQEIDAGITPEAKPYLSAMRQPGIMAAEKIAQILQARGCDVKVVDVPSPGVKPHGWNASFKDINEDESKARAFILGNLRAPAPLTEKGISTAILAAAGEWSSALFMKDGLIRECRENVFQVLHHHPDWRECLAMDEFANAIRVRRETPTGLRAKSVWDEDQDFKLGLWLAQHLRLFIKSESMISAGVRATAVANAYHPVREWLSGLEWDGTPRLADWLSDFAGVTKTEYSSLIGRLFLIGMVARIYRPGCKMDTALILEGLQGEGKSSIARALAGEWFSDTTFVMGDKDSFMALRGKWAYELAELDSFNRSESTRAKAFISSSTDSYRAPYDRVSKDWPRQCVFIGTTNQYEYFKDASGNRRYWPVLCAGELNVEGLRGVREQLFAEAVRLFQDGAQWWPTKDEQQRLVSPEQEAREIGDPWSIAIHEWLLTCGKNEVTALDVLCGALKMEVSKIDGAKQASMRVSVCMRQLGWTKKRRSGGAREWVYVRPEKVVATANPTTGGDDEDHPF